MGYFSISENAVFLDLATAGTASAKLNPNAKGLVVSTQAGADSNIWLYFSSDPDAHTSSFTAAIGSGLLVSYESTVKQVVPLELGGQTYVYAYATAEADVYITELF